MDDGTIRDRRHLEDEDEECNTVPRETMALLVAIGVVVVSAGVSITACYWLIITILKMWHQ
jgi:hypothetical protein